MIARFYNTSKKPNSTALPGAPIYEAEIEFKDPCSIMNPLLRIWDKRALSANYVQLITDGTPWDGYYFINDFTFNIGYWLVSCTKDVLATYRDAILGSTQYVLRSASQFDLNVTDGSYAQKGIGSTACTEMDNPFANLFGRYLLSVMGKGTGANVIYSIPGYALRTLLDYMMKDIDYMELDGQIFDDLGDNMVKALVDPTQYIKGCFWTPYQFTGDSQNITFGWWEAPVVGAVVDPKTPGVMDGPTFTLHGHPQGARGNYLNGDAFANSTLYCPPFPSVSIPRVTGAGTVTTSIRIDPSTGEALLTVKCGNWQTQVSGSAAVQIPVASIGIAPTTQSLGSAVLGGAAQALSGLSHSIGNIWDSVKGGWEHGLEQLGLVGALSQSQVAYGRSAAKEAANNGGSIMNTAVASMAKPSSVGSVGGFGAMSTPWVLVSNFTLLADEDLAQRGRPLCKPVQLGSLSGYTVCQDVEDNFGGIASENAQIVSLLQGGVYIE